MRDLINLMPGAKPALLTDGWIDEFERLDTARWTTVKDAAGSVAAAADGTSRVKFITGAVDNNEAYIATPAIAKMVVGKPMLLYVNLQFAEANVNAANVIVGIIEGGGAADTLLDNGGGPPADYDGACFFKVDGGTRWNFESSDGVTQTTDLTEKVAGGSTPNTLAIEINPLSSTECEFTPWIDTAGGNNLVNPMAFPVNARLPGIVHRHSFTAGLLKVVIGCKGGSASSETLFADLCVFNKKR